MTFRSGPLLLLGLIPLACVSGNEPLDARWMHPASRRASSPLRAPGEAAEGLIAAGPARSLRVAVYADAHGNVAVHRKIIEAIRAEEPDLVIFAGDALTCLPVGHLPDIGAAKYAVPFWPQWLRGHPDFSLLTIIPFPALAHEILGSPCGYPRDPHGFNRFLEITAPLRIDDDVPFLFAPGNHDTYNRADREDVAAAFGSPGGVAGASPDRLWYAVDMARWRFVILDSGTDLPFDGDPLEAGGTQLEWLDATLSEADRAGLNVAVAMHCPPFSSAAEDPPSPRLEERVVKGVLDRHHVDLVLSGHEHAYERLKRGDVTYLITGGGGGRFDEDVPAEQLDPHTETYVAGRFHFLLLNLGDRAWSGSALTPSGEEVDAFQSGSVREEVAAR